MKRTIPIITALLFAFAHLARATDVDNYLVAKGQLFQQTNSTPPFLLPTDEAFQAHASVSPSAPGLITNATLRLPKGTVVALDAEGDGFFSGDTGFATKAQLDSEVGSGTYTFNIFTVNDGTNKPALTIPADNYPATPTIANLNDATGVEHSLDFNLFWNTYTNGTTNDFIVLSLSDTNGDDVFASGGILETNSLNGTNTSVLIPGGTLEASANYEGRLLFVKRTQTNTNSIPGATGIAGFFKETTFSVSTLPDETGPGRIQFGSSSFLLPETQAGELLIPIYRTSTSLTGEVSVTLTISDGTAHSGTDYEVDNLVSVITFTNGVTNAVISVRPADDFLLEGNESLNIALSPPTGGATLGTRSNAVVTIIDNETPTAGRLQFSPVTYNFTEAGRNAILTVTRTGGTAGGVSVAFQTASGSAFGGLDFTHTNGLLNFAAGQASRQIIVPIINDTLDETNENFTVVLHTSSDGASLGSNLVATVTIEDDDSGGTIAFKSAAYSTNENAGAAIITLVRTLGTAGGVTVFCDTQNGLTNGATSGEDYTNTQVTVSFNSNELTKTFSIPLIDDSVAEANETVRLRLLDPTGGAKLGTLTNAILTILDDESSIGITNISYTATETGLKATINLIRQGARITPVAVSYNTVDGTAVSTNDYRGTNNSVVFFPPNVGFKTITIPIVNDTIVDSNETFSVFLHSPTGGVQLVTSPTFFTNTTVTITDNDSGGVISFTVTNFSITEIGPAAKILIARTGGKAGNVTVNLSSTDGTATDGADYTGINTNITFNSGEIAKTILIPIANDTLDETNETVFLALRNPTGGASLGTKSNAVANILDNDVGGTISLSSTSYTTNENNTAFVVTVNRAIGKASAVGVSFTTADGSAVANNDYSPTEGTLTFGSNEVSKVVSVTITNDTVAEGSETLSFRIFTPTGGATLGANTNATLTIRDDESSVSFTNASYSIGESGPVVNVNVVREGALITQVGVGFTTVDDGAVSTNDYRGTNGFIVFPPNIGFKTITIPIANDTLVESNETFSIFLHSPTGGVQFAESPGRFTNTIVTITNNDAGGVINFKATTFSTNENNNAIITLTRTNGSASGVSVTFVTDDGGSATGGVDYSNATQTVTFNANETSRTIVVPIVKDSLDETNETVNLSLSNVQGGASLGVVSNAVLTITDDDSGGTINFRTASQSTNENAGTMLVTLVRNGGSASGVTVDYRSQSGSTSGEADFQPVEGTLIFASNELSKTISITISNDVIAEGSENFTLSLTNATGGATVGASNTTTLTIIDDESSVAFTNAAYAISEAGPGISVNVLRSGALLTPVSVNFSTVDDSAVSTNDYRGTNGTILFPAGIGFKTITIPIVNDTIVEENEIFRIFLHSPSNGVQLGTITNTAVTITDNDVGGVISFKAATFTTNENANAVITITRTNGAASGVNVTFTAEGGSASSPADYTGGSQTITFGANQTTTNVIVPIVNDSLDETNETVNLALSNVTGGASLGSVSNAVLTILDNDNGGTVQFSALSYTTNEGAAVLNAVVIRTNGLASDVTVDFFTTAGTAGSGDFTSTNGTLTFGAGVTNKLIPVGVLDDVLPDGSKSFSITLSNATGGAVIGVRSNATMNITDDENSVVLESASYTTNESAGAVSIRLLRTGVLSSQVSLTFSTSNGTAVAGSDYVGTNLNVTFPAGSSFAVIPVRILNDFAVENAESFSVALHSPVGGVQIGSTSNAVVNITDDDAAGTIRFSSSTYSGSEGTSVNVQVQRISGLASNVTVQFNMVNGTASSGDYVNVSQLITFAAGETNRNISVSLATDALTETVETVNLSLVNPTGGASLGSPNTATLNINNASAATCPPVTFNLAGPGMKASSSGGAFVAPAIQVNGSLVLGILNVTGIEAGTTTRTITFTLSTIPAGSTGSFPVSTGSDFFGYSVSIIQTSPPFCSTTKTYNSDAPSSGCINIIEWNTVTKVFRATFNFTAHGVDCGTTCAGGPDCPTPTDTPSITSGQVWVNYMQSP